VSSKGKAHELIKFDIQKFKIESSFRVPMTFIEGNKYFLFETSRSIFIVHRNGLLNFINKSEMKFVVRENTQFRTQQNECFCKFHYMREEKTLVMYERTSESFQVVDFRNEDRLEGRRVPKFTRLKTIKVQFVQQWVMVQTAKKVHIYSLPKMGLVAEAQLKAKYFELASKYFRLVTYDFETNSVSVSLREETTMARCAFLYHQNFKKIDGLFINSEPNFRFVYFSLSEKMSNKIYVLCFDEVQKSIAYLYTFNLDYFNITRMVFMPRNNVAVCFDKANKELRVYKTLNIYENRNYIDVKTVSETCIEQHLDLAKLGESSSKKPEFVFDASTKFICQEGIYSFDYSEGVVKTVFKFEPIGIRRFLSFDYAPKSLSSEFRCYLFTHEMDGELSTHFIVFNDKTEKVFHDETIIWSRILEIEEKSRTVQILGLLQDRKSLRLITCRYDTASRSYRNSTLRILMDENPHSLIHSFYVHNVRKELYILNKKPETFELIIARYDVNSQTFMHGHLIRLGDNRPGVPQRVHQNDSVSAEGVRAGVVRQAHLRQLRREQGGQDDRLHRQHQAGVHLRRLHIRLQ
jgi:hypothetical protein